MVVQSLLIEKINQNFIILFISFMFLYKWNKKTCNSSWVTLILTKICQLTNADTCVSTARNWGTKKTPLLNLVTSFFCQSVGNFANCTRNGEIFCSSLWHNTRSRLHKCNTVKMELRKAGKIVFPKFPKFWKINTNYHRKQSRPKLLWTFPKLWKRISLPYTHWNLPTCVQKSYLGYELKILSWEAAKVIKVHETCDVFNLWSFSFKFENIGA